MTTALVIGGVTAALLAAKRKGVSSDRVYNKVSTAPSALNNKILCEKNAIQKKVVSLHRISEIQPTGRINIGWYVFPLWCIERNSEMKLKQLTELYEHHPSVEVLDHQLSGKRPQHILANGVCASAQALLLAALWEKKKRPMLVITDTGDDASYMQSDLSALLENENDVLLFPASYRIRQRNNRPDESYEIQRAEVLNRLNNQKSACIVVSYAEALCDKVVKKTTLSNQTIHLQKGMQISMQSLSDRLTDLGFLRVDFVYEPGQYAIRGSIVDIFSFSCENPYRFDFFGDEIDTIRVFDIETQLSKSPCDATDILPTLDEKDGSLAATLAEYLDADTLVVSTDLALLRHKMQSGLENNEENKVLFEQLTDQYSSLELSSKSIFTDFSRFQFNTLPQPIYHKNFDLLSEALLQYQSDGYHIYILSDSRKQTDRIDAILKEKDERIVFTPVERTLHGGFVDEEAKLCCLTDHQLFERYHKVQQKADSARKGKMLMTLKELNQLQIGDYVVHADHGIGKFGGLVRTDVNGKKQEMIKLLYRDNDILFVSIHSLHRISKYRGKEGDAPTISKLGSGQWERMKERTKQKVKDIARDLIKLYAQRRQEQGFQYSPDSYMQHELEASFIYEDTPDQQKATFDLKHDMESPVPMDRLICGDVGFGKTELAMRAAFKAATDGKQTAVLVPTTVLAMQHYHTFSERFANFPVKVEYLSRGKSAVETKHILEQLAKGEIDILIGTHKLVGKSVHFKDLGLLIIDEEQKFGVSTKEKLRQLKVNVDTLTLTATPIPRTLQFSLLGARDLSVMTTPPPNRYPVQTELITIDDEDIIQEAIREEINRNGQVFVVSNRIQSLPRVENKIRRLCPDARIAIAHGQMPTEQMEQILTDFINYDFDVLISTSIIESGVDIPNVNTIIINHAEMFGLSDLHQLRGRVGRSNRKAYCYLVTPPMETLTTDARRRLQAVETFAELGSGFHLAMQDLDIRGAGNMLGAEQSGFIADLGYETYQRILNEAVHELKEEEFGELFEEENATISLGRSGKQQWVTDCQLESDLEIGFPTDYIENISERITLYRELDNLQDETALLTFTKNLIDRFGVMPPQAEELLSVVRLRWQCMRMGIEKVVLKQERMIIYFPSNLNSPYYQSDIFGKILTFITNNYRRCQVRDLNGKRSAVISEVRSIREAFDVVQKFDGSLTIV